MSNETKGDRDLHFHYSRAERLAGRGGEPDQRGKSWFKRNRSLAIILLDVLLLLLMFFLLQFVFKPGAASRRVSGVSFTLSAFVFDEEVYATVEITRTRGGSSATADGAASGGSSGPAVGSDAAEVAGAAGQLATIRFPDGTEVSDVVPPVGGEPALVRVVYPVSESRRVTVSVNALGRSFSLSVDAAGE